MIQYVQILGEKRPFKFGMRELFAFSQRVQAKAVAGEEIDLDNALSILNVISMDFDAFIEFAHMAHVKGCRRHNKVNSPEIQPLTMDDLEDAIDDEPGAFAEIQKAMEASQNPSEPEQGNGEKKPTG
jgi:hypothetical protein